MKRASSPPDATFIRGASGVPGLAATMNSIRSMPDGPGFPASVSIWRFEARPLELERRQFGHDRLVERLGRLAPACRTASRRRHHRHPRDGTPPCLERPQSAAAVAQRLQAPPRIAGAPGPAYRPCTCTCARRRAARRGAPPISPAPSDRRRRHGAPRPCARSASPISVSTRSSDWQTWSSRPPAVSRRRSSLRSAALRRDTDVPSPASASSASASASAYCSADIIIWRASASLASSPSTGFSARSSSAACSR